MSVIAIYRHYNIARLDAKKKCPNCGTQFSCRKPGKYVGKLMHDFRRSAAHEAYKAGASLEDCAKITGHADVKSLKRYADLFSREEETERMREVQEQRRAWREAESAKPQIATAPVTLTRVQSRVQ
jgi:hypothetical protein